MESESEIIWHYTSNVEPFLSKEAVFLGSRSDFFEDETELVLGQRLFDDVITKFPRLEEVTFFRSNPSYYIACFTKSFDEKRFWDERTPDGGFAIGFDQALVKEQINRHNLSNIQQKESVNKIYGMVYYCRHCFGNHIENEIKRIEDHKCFENALKVASDKTRTIIETLEKNERFKNLLINMKRMTVCAFYKDMTRFAWENEYRIVACAAEDSNIKEKNINGRPCYPIFNIKPEMIKQIIVSPYGDVSENILKAKNLCNGIGISPKIVTKSKFYGDYR